MVSIAIGAGVQTAYAASAKVAQYSNAAEAAKISVNLLAEKSLIQQQMAIQAPQSPTGAITRAVPQQQASSMALDVVMNRLDNAVIQKMKQLGVNIVFSSVKYLRVSAVIHDPTLLNALAKMPEVRSIQKEYGAIKRVGAVTSRAAKALKADVAKATFSLDGTGQKIGVISDSFACKANRDANTLPALGVAGTLTGSPSQDSGDLPATVEILSDMANPTAASGACTDEGAAMGELIHDVAPGAAIAFHDVSSEASFSTGINQLCSAPVKATVLVDDISFPNEPYYQDGIVAQAAAACVANGVPYYSAAGNDANTAFQETFVDINAADDQAVPPTGNDFHQWHRATSTGTIRDGFIAVTVPPGGDFTAVLEWNQPFDSVSPGKGSQVDMDLYVNDAPNINANILSKSANRQGTSGAPLGDAFEFVQYNNATPFSTTVYVAVDHFKGSQTTIPQSATTPVELRLLFLNTSVITIEGINDRTSAFGGSTQYGHTMAAGVTSVAAVPWYDTASFDPTLGPSRITDPEYFSSRGGNMTIQFDKNGNFSPRSSFEPDISAVDANNTRFFDSPNPDTRRQFGEPDSFQNFFGTSAAAPNAAAVAALIRQRNSSLTPAQVNATLENTAIDIAGFRAAVGDDDVTGIGLIDANAAVISIDATAPSIALVGASNISIVQGSAFVDPGVTVTDNMDNGLTATVTGSVNTAAVGVYTLQYNAKDLSGNAAATVTRTVKVVAAGTTNNGANAHLSLSGGGTVDVVSSGELLSSFSTAGISGATPAGVSFPMGQISYSSTVAVGASKTVSLTFSNALPANTVLYKIHSPATLYSLITQGSGANQWSLTGAKTISINITDGGPLDLDGTANGTIIDPVAVGSATGVVASSGGGGGGCVIATQTRFDPVLLGLFLISLLYSFSGRKRQLGFQT